MSEKNFAGRRMLMTGLLILLLGTTACSPTPGERIRQLDGVVTEIGEGVVDLDLSGKSVTDADMSYIHGFCSNSASLKRIRTLDLSDTAITDKALDFMSLQKGFSSSEGLAVLILRNTSISEEAIEKFHLSAPECTIIRN